MPVSYLSKTHASSPYVLPLDLGLLNRVLSIKETDYVNNAKSIQQGIDVLGSLDLMKNQDKEYMKGKINSLVSNINSLGGADLSDPSLVNQIQGMGSDIYGDPNIITALASTKQARKLITGYEQFKTNPKLSKGYAEQNEWYDMRGLNSWLSDGQVGSAYNGPSVPTPYVNYKQDHLKAFDKLKADLTENVTVDGLYILKDSNERITPQRLMAMAQDLLTPEQRGQMKRDAVYTYSAQAPLPPAALIGKAAQEYQNKMYETKQLKDYYEAQANAAVSDPDARRNYNLLADAKANELITLNTASQEFNATAPKRLQEDPDEFMYQVYSNDYFRGLANRFSVNRTSRSVVPNQAEMFTRREAQDKTQFDATIAQNDKHFYDQLAFNYWKEGYKMTYDPTTGQIQTIPMSTNINTTDPENLKVTSTGIRDANNQLQLQKASLTNDFLSNFLAHHPELGITAPSQGSQTGVTRQIVGQQFLEGYNQQPGFQPEDLAALSSPATRGQIEGALRTAGVKNIGDQMILLDQLRSNYDAVLNGKGKTVGTLPDGFVDLVQGIQLTNERISANDKILADRKALIYDKAQLSAEERAIYDDYQNNPGNYEATFAQRFGLSNDSPDALRVLDARRHQVRSIESKFATAGINFNTELSNYLANVPTRDIYQTQVFNPTDKIMPGISNFISAEVAAGHGDIFLGGKKSTNEPLTAINPKSITPQSSGMFADGTGRFYIQSQVTIGTGDNQEQAILQTPLSDTQAAALGIQRNPLDNINYSVNTLGQSGDMYVYGNNDLAITVQVFKKNVNSLNDYSSFAIAKFFTLDANGNKIPDPRVPGGYKYDSVQIPNSDAATPAEAFARAKQAVINASKIPGQRITIEDFRQKMLNYNRK